MDEELLRGLYAEKSSRQASIEEVQLWALYEALAEVLMIWLEKIDDAARLEYREPGTSRVVRQAAIEGEGIQVEELAHARGAHLDEGLELSQILHVEDRSHIALNIRCDVVREPIVGANLAIIKGWIETFDHGLERIRRESPRCFELFGRERQEGEEGSPPRQGLGYSCKESELLGARHDVFAGSWIGVHRSLEIGENFRHSLGLVEDEAVTIRVKQAAGIIPRKAGDIGIFEREIGLVGEAGLGQGGLARLSGAGDTEYRETLLEAFEGTRSLSWNHENSLRHLYNLSMPLTMCMNIQRQTTPNLRGPIFCWTNVVLEQSERPVCDRCGRTRLPSLSISQDSRTSKPGR